MISEMVSFLQTQSREMAPNGIQQASLSYPVPRYRLPVSVTGFIKQSVGKPIPPCVL